MNCNSSKGKCLDEFTRKNITNISSNSEKPNIHGFLCGAPFKGKGYYILFIFCIKIMSRDLGFCPDRYEIWFFSQKKNKL